MQNRIKFSQTLKNWRSTSFEQSFKDEIANLNSDDLPTQKAVTQGGYVKDVPISTTILHHTENQDHIIIKAGLFFTEIVPSCSCGDEPLEVNAYCEIEITINKSNAKTTFVLLDNAHYPDI